ncbi:glycosyl transferase family 2 [ANME-1 cluster archaeon GoMg4]|nr:glycosyl transferase family 2 [ANME-1 cluster archaeon GoMg4]
MFSVIPLIAIALTSIIAGVYLTYFYASFSKKGEGKKVKELKDYPPISIVIPAYNEAKNIETRVNNLIMSDYPLEKIELIIVDDASEDDTTEIVSELIDLLKEYDVDAKLISNEKRSGVNFSHSRGIKEAKNEIVVCTDADVSFDNNSLKRIVANLLSGEGIGAVCGDSQPLSKKGLTGSSESAYRSVYGRITKWESDIASTFNFNGPLFALKKKAPFTLDIKKGAYDAGIAFSVIRNGYKALYIPEAKVFEHVAVDLKSQKKQKVRRAARLLRATWENRDMLGKHGKFGTLVLPLRFLAFFICPIFFFIALSLWIYLFSSISIFFLPLLIALFVLTTVSGIFRSNLFSTFIIHQFYLLLGSFYMFRDMRVWEPPREV